MRRPSLRRSALAAAVSLASAVGACGSDGTADTVADVCVEPDPHVVGPDGREALSVIAEFRCDGAVADGVWAGDGPPAGTALPTLHGDAPVVVTVAAGWAGTVSRTSDETRTLDRVEGGYRLPPPQEDGCVRIDLRFDDGTPEPGGGGRWLVVWDRTGTQDCVVRGGGIARP